MTTAKTHRTESSAWCVCSVIATLKRELQAEQHFQPQLSEQATVVSPVIAQ
jgi:hypothetical protein